MRNPRHLQTIRSGLRFHVVRMATHLRLHAEESDMLRMAISCAPTFLSEKMIANVIS